MYISLYISDGRGMGQTGCASGQDGNVDGADGRGMGQTGCLRRVIPHRATRDMIYRDIAFAEGDLAFVMVPAANRDPSATERPDEFIIDRAPARHFAFGAGMHSCPGAHLAKMEMSMALLGLLEACADIQRAAPPEWEPGQEGRTLRRLDITIRKMKPLHG